MSLPAIAELKYEIENNQLNIDYKCECLKAQATLNLADYSTDLRIQISDPDYEIIIQHDGLNLSSLVFVLSTNNDLICNVVLALDRQKQFETLLELPVLAQTSIKVKSSDSFTHFLSEVNFEVNGEKTDLNVEIELPQKQNSLAVKFSSKKFETEFKSIHILESLWPVQCSSIIDLAIHNLASYSHNLNIDGLDSQLSVNIKALPLINGQLKLSRDEVFVHNFNINLFDIECSSNFDYSQENGFILDQTLIRNGKTGEYYFASTPVAIVDGQLQSVSGGKLFIGPLKFEYNYEDSENFNLELPNYVRVIAEDGVFDGKILLNGYTLNSNIDMKSSPLKQIINLQDSQGNEVFGLIVEFSVPNQQFAIQLKSNNVFKTSIMYDTGMYAVVTNIQDFVEIQISGENTESIKGSVDIERIELSSEFDISRKSNHVCYGQLVYQGVTLVDFKKQNPEKFYLKLESDNMFNFALERNDNNIKSALVIEENTIIGLADLSQNHLKVTYEGGNGAFGVMDLQKSGNDRLQIQIKSDWADFLFNGQLNLTNGNVRYNGNLLNVYSSEGDFSLEKFTMLTIETPFLSVECDEKECLVESTKDEHAFIPFSLSLRFGSDLTLNLGDSNRNINFVITPRDFEVKAVYDEYIKIQFMINNELVAVLQTIILDTKIDIQSELGKNLTLSVDGPNAKLESSVNGLNELEFEMREPVELRVEILNQNMEVQIYDQLYALNKQANGHFEITSRIA